MVKREEALIHSFLLPLTFSLALLLLDRYGLLGGVHSAIDIVTVPVRRELVSMRQNISGSFSFASYRELKEENSKLKQKFARMSVDRVELERLQQENKSLRRQLEAPFAPDVQFLPSRIVGISNDTITIDKGSFDGVATGQAVVVEKNLVGVVSNVFDKTAIIYLLTHPDSKLPAETLMTNARGILAKIGGKLTLDKILQENEIEVGAVVVTSGHESIPSDLIIGTVSEVISQEQDLFKTAVVTPIVEYGKLVTVFVVVN